MAIYIITSGVISTGEILSFDSMYISNGGVANNTTVDYYGSMYISSGGVANSTTVNSGGYMSISSGGTATDIVWTPCVGYVFAADGAYVTYTSKYSGVYFGSNNKLFSHTQTMTGKIVSGSMYVMDGGVANSTYVNKGDMYIYNNGVANETIICGGIYDNGLMILTSGGAANKTTVYADGVLYISSGAVANDTTVNGGSMLISSGGTATAVKENGGYVYVAEGANVTFVSNTVSGLTLSQIMTVHSNTTANEINVNGGGGLYIYDSGVANSTTLNGGGNLFIFSGGVANSTTVNSGGDLDIRSGGVANSTIVSGGSMTVLSGGTATNIVWTPLNGIVDVRDGAYVTYASVYSGVYFGSSDMLISHAETMDYKQLSGHSMYIMDGGVANYTTLTLREITSANHDYAVMHISSGGIANNTTVDSGGQMKIFSGGIANNIILEEASNIWHHGNFFISGAAVLRISNGGVANSTIVNSGGSIYIHSGGTHTGLLLLKEGALCSAYSGSIIDFFIADRNESSDYLINDLSMISGTPTYTITVSAVQKEGMYKLAQGASDFNGSFSVGNGNYDYGIIDTDGNACEYNSMKYRLVKENDDLLLNIIYAPATVFIYNSDGTLVSSGTEMNKVSLSSGNMHISSGGSASNTTVNAGGTVFVSSGGTANSTIVNSKGYMHISSGGSASNTTVNIYGSMCISSGGVANRTTVNSGGRMYISSGGVANSTTLSGTLGNNYYFGSMYIYGGVANSTTVNSGGNMYIFSDGVANNTIVNIYGSMYISSGGVANRTTVNSGGRMYISSGGVANRTTVNSGNNYYSGSMCIYGGVANSTTVNSGGNMYIWIGGMANSTTINGGHMVISAGGVAKSTTVNSGGNMYIWIGGMANSTTVNPGGSIVIGSDGVANSTTINSGGNMYISNGGVANSTTVNSSGYLHISSGGIHSGRLFLNTGAVVSAYSGSIIDFTLTGNTASSYDNWINNLSLIAGAATYTITVSENQAYGEYILARGASSFNGSISIGDGQIVYGKLSVNGNILRYGDYDYILSNNEGTLSLQVAEADKTAPVAPVIHVDISSPTNKNVTVSATFAEDSVKNEYSLNNGTWKTYQASIIFTKNGTVAFRSTDKAGNVSEITTYNVSNIDKVFPTLSITGNTATWSTGDIILSAIADDDCSGVKSVEYSFNNIAWINGSSVTVTENKTVYFRVTDNAGNVTSDRVVVDKIDKKDPIFSISGNSTTWTTQDIVLFVDAYDDGCSGIKSVEYSLDNIAWINESSVTVTENKTVYFRVTDNAGNVTIDNVIVDKIDKSAPIITISGSLSEWINHPATISADVIDEVSGVKSVEYSFDNKTWFNGSSVYISEETMLYFKATDNIGNVSTQSIEIKVDTIAPTLSIVGNVASWTNKDVVLSAVTDDNCSGVKSVEYSFDNTTWFSGSSVAVSENRTVYFKVTDHAGNITTDSVVVDKINKTSPVFQQIVLSSEEWTFDPLTVIPTVTDDIDFSLTYRIGNGVAQTYHGEAIVVKAPNYIYFTAVDAAGNSSTQSVYVKAGYVPISSGMTSSGLNVSHGTLEVYKGGVAQNTVVSSGGTLLNSGVVSGLQASAGAIISGGGRFYLTSDTTIASGIMGQTQDQYLIGVSTFSKFVANNDWHVDQKLLLKEAKVTSGGSMTLYRGASATILDNYGYTEVLSKGNVRSVTVHSGAELKVNGGVAAAVTVSKGGVENLTNGGSALRTSVYGSMNVVSNAIANSTTVFAQGTQIVGVKGIAKSGSIQGGLQQVFGGSSYRDYFSGGSQVISNGGKATETTVSAAQQIIRSNGLAESTTLIMATQHISNGGLAYINDCTDTLQLISSGGTAFINELNNGSQIVKKGALASQTILHRNALQLISSGGLAVDTVINFGAEQHVLTSGSASVTQVNSGGSYVIDYDGFGENVIVANGGTFSLHGNVTNLTVADDAHYFFNLDTATFRGSLDCYLKPNELHIINEILMFSELDSLTLRVKASNFGQDQYDAFSTEFNEDLEYNFILVLDDDKTIFLRDNSHYWYKGERYSLEYNEDDWQYYLNKSTQEKTRVLISSSGNIDVLEAQSSKVNWSRNNYQDFGEVIAVQETGLNKTVYINVNISVKGLLQNATAIDFVNGGTLQFGTNTFSVDMYSHDEAESIVYGVHNASTIHRRLASLPALPAGVTMNISAAAVNGSAHAAAFINNTSGMVFSGGITGKMQVNAQGVNADARGIFGAGVTSVTEPINNSAYINAEATTGQAYALGASELAADDLDMVWNINAESAQSDATAVGITGKSIGQWINTTGNQDNELCVTASAGKKAAAYGFSAYSHINGSGSAAKFTVSELFNGDLKVSATGNDAEAWGVESSLELNCNMSADITVTATAQRNANAIGLTAINQTLIDGTITVHAEGSDAVTAYGVMKIGASSISGKINVSAESSHHNALAVGYLGNADTLSTTLTLYAEGSNSVRAFGFVEDFDTAQGGSLNTLAANGKIDITARSSNINDPSMSPVYAIGGRINESVYGSICVSALSANAEQETHAKAIHAETVTVEGIIGASATTQAVAVAANAENTQLNLTVGGVLFAGNIDLDGNNYEFEKVLKAARANIADLSEAYFKVTHEAYSVYAYDEDDSVTIKNKAVVVGDMEFAGGSNKLTISNGAYYLGDINAENGSLQIDFVLDAMRIDDAIINGHVFMDSVLNVDVSNVKSNGCYSLISGFEGQLNASTVTISHLGSTTTLTIGNMDYVRVPNYGQYRCYVKNDQLIFEVSGISEANITVTSSDPDNSKKTNKNVILTAEFSSQSQITKKQYRINGGVWHNYTGSVTVTENAMVEFRMVDSSNKELIEQYNVSNIDKVEPVISQITATKNEHNKDEVIVSANFYDNVELASCKYKIGNGQWQDYTEKITVTENTTVYFQATDTAGNVTNEYIVVNNIGELLPIISLTANNNTATKSAELVATTNSNNKIYYNTVSADYSGVWLTYTSAITVTDNGTYYFKTTDNSGNVGYSSITFNNIDHIQPDIPGVNADITWLTNQNVTVFATFSEDSVVKQYSFDNKLWYSYFNEGIVMQNNGKVYFRGIDTAGNISDVNSYTVDCIDKKSPEVTGFFDFSNDTYTLTFSSKDANGVAGYNLRYSLDGNSYIYYDGTIYDDIVNLYKIGKVKQFQVQAIDNAGNISNWIDVKEKGGPGSDDSDFNRLIFVSSKYNASINGKKQSGISLTYGDNAFSSVDNALKKYPDQNNILLVVLDNNINGNTWGDLPFVVAGNAVVPTIQEKADSYSYKSTSTAKNTLNISVDTGSTEFIRFATVNLTNADVNTITGGKCSCSEDIKSTVDKKGTVTDTYKFSYTANANGKVTANNSEVDLIKGYSTITLNNSEIGELLGANTKETANSKLVDSITKYQKTISEVNDSAAAGSVNLQNDSSVESIAGFSNVTLKYSAADSISNFTSKDSKSETATYDELKNSVTRKVTVTHSETTAGTLKANDSTLSDVTGFATVTLQNVTGGADFSRLDEAGEKYSTVKETLNIKTNQDGSVTGTYSKTETFTRAGKFTATGSVVGDIENFSNVTLDGSAAGAVSNFETAKIVTSGTAFWSDMYDYGRPEDYDLNLDAMDLKVTETKSLNGSVILKNHAYAESIDSFQSVTMTGSEVGKIDNVNKVTVNKGDSFISSYTGTEDNDILTIAKNAVLTASKINLGAEAKDTLAINGTLILTGSEDDLPFVNATKITGKGEIAAVSEVFADLDVAFANTLDVGETSENFRGTAYEKADDTLKKAVKWDGATEYDGWLGDWTGYTKGSDDVDYIKFKAVAGDELIVSGIDEENWTLFDSKGNLVKSKYIFADNEFKIAGEYIIKLENDADESIAYSIALA